MSKKDIFIFDIDGTLADHKNVRSPYDESKVELDKPIIPVFKVLAALFFNYKIIFVSGRTEVCREQTIFWLRENLAKHNVYVSDDNISLFMRQSGDHRADFIIKKEIYDGKIIPFCNIIGVFDDRMQVCRMLYENNIFCFNVNQGLKEF